MTYSPPSSGEMIGHLCILVAYYSIIIKLLIIIIIILLIIKLIPVSDISNIYKIYCSVILSQLEVNFIDHLKIIS